MSNIYRVAEHFFAVTTVTDIQEYGTGRVNDTFLVTVGGQKGDHFILQRISSAVFAHPEWIMENLRIVSRHVLKKLETEGNPIGWRMPGIHPSLSGADFYRDNKGSFWRVLEYIDGCTSYMTIRSLSQAREAGLALGRFHRLVCDLDPALLHDTLPGFHVTPLYLAQYDRVIAGQGQKSSTEVRYCQNFITRRRERTHVLVGAEEQGKLFFRPIHGDPKLSNILFDEKSGKAVSLIDLDTVKPGLVQYDVGDCLRSCCNAGGEEGALPVFFETELCREILLGYVKEAATFLSSRDYEYFYDSTWLIAFELGLRFFTDYLQGNIYFKSSSPWQNLERAMVQFSLVASIEKQKKEIKRIINDIA